MTERRISDRQRRWLGNELDYWQEHGIVSAEQSQQILDSYEGAEQRRKRNGLLASFALYGVSAFLVGLGVLLLISYNGSIFLELWCGLDRAAKLLVLLALIAGTHAGAYHLRFRRQARRSAEVLFFLGCLLFGAGIWLVAQAYHLDSHYPDGVWWWAVGVLPFALLLDTVLIHLLLVGLLALWAGMEVLNFSHLAPWAWLGWLPNGAYSLPLLALPGLVWCYRRDSVLGVGLYAPLLAWWAVLQGMTWGLEEETLFVVAAVGPLFLIVSESHPRGSRMAIPYRFCGTLLTAGALLPLSVAELYDDLIRAAARRGLIHSGVGLVVLLALLGIAIVLAAFLCGNIHDGRSSRQRLAELLLRQGVPVAVVLAVVFAVFWGVILGDDLVAVPIVLVNLITIAFAVWLMQVGLRDERGWPFAGGVAYFLLWAIVRYIDLFGDAGGTLGAALMFFLCGGALFGLARFWDQRGRWQHV